jgi:hypothetical protein
MLRGREVLDSTRYIHQNLLVTTPVTDVIASPDLPISRAVALSCMVTSHNLFSATSCSIIS